MLKVKTKSCTFVILLIILLLIVAVSALFSGRYAISLSSFWAGVTQPVAVGSPAWVVWHLRLPRVIAAIICGLALAGAGSCYQAIFRNPLVSPDILGVSAGAGLGAALAIYNDCNIWQIEICAFIGGLMTVGLALLVGRIVARQRGSLYVLVLTGVVIGSLANAGISLIKILADPYNKLPTITFWMMGSLSAVGERDCYLTALVVLISFILLVVFSWQLDLLSCGDTTARSLGVPTVAVKLLFITLATLMTGAVVSLTGTIGWVGLIIPHAARAIVGAAHRTLVPVAAICGAIFLLVVDTLARTLSEVEIPVGVMISFIGSPLFILILIKNGRVWR